MADPFSLGALQLTITDYPSFTVEGADGCSGGIAWNIVIISEAKL